MIGIFGGTFDPVHFGHLRCALEAKEKLSLREIRLVPCRIPAHRMQPVATASQRVDMISLAIKGLSDFVLDDREMKRAGPSYMVDTLATFRGDFPDQSLCLVIGMDAFAGLLEWKRWKALFDYAHIVVLDRPGEKAQHLGELDALVEERKTDSIDQLNAVNSGLLYFLEVTQLAISSSSIKEQLARGRSAQYLLPANVHKYIDREKLYQ